MPVHPTYPGVYIEEIPSGVRTITGVATSITVFIGQALRGPVNKASTITSNAEFERTFGGLWSESMLGYAVHDFYLNGGSEAVIVRLFHPYYKNDDERSAAITAAKAAANEVVKAINDSAAAAPAEIAKDGRNKADEINGSQRSQAEKIVANAVAAAAETAATKDGASKDKIKQAADDAILDAVADAVPVTKKHFTVGGLPLVAANEGKWGENLTAFIDFNVSPDVAKAMGLGVDDLFNLTVQDGPPNGPTEVFRNLTIKNSSRRIDKVLEAESNLVRWGGAKLPVDADMKSLQNAWNALPAGKTPKQVDKDVTTEEQGVINAQTALDTALNAKPFKQNDVDNARSALATAQATLKRAKATDGGPLSLADFVRTGYQDQKLGLYALEPVDLFNILCIPPFVPKNDTFDIDPALLADAAKYCHDHRAILLVDAPSDWTDKQKAIDRIGGLLSPIGSDNAKNVAIFFPRIKRPNLLHDNRIEEFVPSGAMAGIFARTDSQRGVWKAPAGLDAGIAGAFGLSVSLTNEENGLLNPLGINCLRTFPAVGSVVWGARTLQGDDRLASEWKYIPVRRTALFIEESLYRGTQWVVFEPNDEPLWAQIRLNVGAFMHNLFRQGAFQGTTPREAYFVKCDRETTTQNDINLGIVNIVVGFAPLKPAEFVIIKLQQMAGQIEV